MTGLAASGISAGYGSEPVLRSVSIAIEPGRVLAIAGPNGAGKTTLLRALARLLPLSGGAITCGERPAESFGAAEWARHVAMVSQEEESAWPITVHNAVSLGRAPHRGWLLPMDAGDREVVAQALDRMGLGAHRGRALPELSGGERRRVAIARGLAQRPSVLLLDEPTAFLDLRHQTELGALLRSLAREEGLAVAIAVHDLNFAARVADRIVLLSDGRIATEGSPAEVLSESHLSAAYGTAVSVTSSPSGPVVLPRWPSAA